MQKAFCLLVVCISLVISSCKKDDDTHCEAFVWGYEGNEGPAEWGGCFDECSGNTQSPLNIASATVDATLEALVLHYEEVPIDIFFNGRTLEFEHEPGSTLTLNAMVFNLLQFHFHTESEHAISGSHYPMEVHLVHKHEPTGQLAVVGIFFEEGDENMFLQHFADHLPDTKDERYSTAELVNAHDLLPTEDDYFTYGGSLTTPPCSEIVTWFVMKTPIEASPEQIQKFRTILNENNRPVQDLAGRTIREHQ